MSTLVSFFFFPHFLSRCISVQLGSPGERGKKRLTVYKCHGVAGPERLTHDKFEKLKKAGFTGRLEMHKCD